MNLSPATEVVPLEPDGHGVMRVGKTRVTLDTLVAAFTQGATAEEIVQQYPSLQLADVYSVLGYYLRHQAEVQEYLQQRQAQHEAAQRHDERLLDPQGIRARLLARRAGKNS